jgi:hypothetical protein
MRPRGIYLVNTETTKLKRRIFQHQSISLCDDSKKLHYVDFAQCSDIPFLKCQRISYFAGRNALLDAPCLEVGLAVHSTVWQRNGVVDDITHMLCIRNIPGQGVEFRRANGTKTGGHIRVKVDGRSRDIGITGRRLESRETGGKGNVEERSGGDIVESVMGEDKRAR